MNEKDRFSSYTYSEDTTGGGQHIRFTARQEDLETIKSVLKLIKGVELPVTHQVNIAHGAFAQYSRYNITQHRYAGGGNGFVEALEIKNPPDDRCGNVIHELKGLRGTFFTEFESIENAISAFEKHWGEPETPNLFKKEKGFLKIVKCGKLVPWFYATGGIKLIGDYALPQDLSDDPHFRLGKKFVVRDQNDTLQIKTCLGTRYLEETDYLSGQWKTRQTRVVYFDDGTTWRDDLGFNREVPGILDFKKQEFDRRMMYKVVVILQDGRSQEGWVEFKPSDDYPTLEEYLHKYYNFRVESIDVVEILEERQIKCADEA